MTKEEMRRKVKDLSPEQKEFLKTEIKRQRLETEENSPSKTKLNQGKTEKNKK